MEEFVRDPGSEPGGYSGTVSEQRLQDATGRIAMLEQQVIALDSRVIALNELLAAGTPRDINLSEMSPATAFTFAMILSGIFVTTIFAYLKDYCSPIPPQIVSLTCLVFGAIFYPQLSISISRRAGQFARSLTQSRA